MFKLYASKSIIAELKRLVDFVLSQNDIPEFFIIRNDKVIAKITTKDTEVLIKLLKSGYTLNHIEDK